VYIMRVVDVLFTVEFGGSCCRDQASTSNGWHDGSAA